MKTNFLRYLTILIIVLLSACNNAYINHESKFDFSSINNNYSYKNPFIVCASFYTNPASIFSTAEVYCFKQHKKPKLLRITYFTNCSLIKPISYVFICE